MLRGNVKSFFKRETLLERRALETLTLKSSVGEIIPLGSEVSGGH